jgi:hypothetical protein
VILDTVTVAASVDVPFADYAVVAVTAGVDYGVSQCATGHFDVSRNAAIAKREFMTKFWGVGRDVALRSWLMPA